MEVKTTVMLGAELPNDFMGSPLAVISTIIAAFKKPKSNYKQTSQKCRYLRTVLRPPGGGTSDIFGGDMPQTPRAVKNHMQSNIFSTEKDHVKNSGDQPRRGQKNLDSYQRLFGEPERPVTPAKNHMKSNIPFGSSTEAAQTLITNGNGHYNGKCGSVSSASSSVSSSTENLKMNGHSKTETDEMCPTPMSTPSSPRTEKSEASNIEINCEEKKAMDSLRSKISENHADTGALNEGSQTRRETGSNPENPHSYSVAPDSQNRQEPLEPCVDKPSKAPTPRNPITGLGLGNDGVGGLKPKKPRSRRDGNPVTGEGYKPNDFNNHTPSMNGANQIINKNRIPPGGYSSGLW
ncbi:hypothetical protein GQX74_015262 [Glossina fuscipes]|nr:hypothetical protein GQX74_015262 [Glossina fuscipes]